MNIAWGSFFREYLRHPLRTAAILPTSAAVAREMTSPVPAEGEPVIVELGPGTGVFTSEIQRRLAGRGRLVAVELNDRFAGYLRARFPGVDVVASDGVQLRQILDDRGLEHADVIVSGLPHALFDHDLQRRFMDTFKSCLAPDGRLVAHAYVHAAWSPRSRHFRRLLETAFGEVAVGKVHWTNVFPVFVYIAGSMHRSDAGHRATGARSGSIPWNGGL